MIKYPKWSLWATDYDIANDDAFPSTVLVVQPDTGCNRVGVMLCHTDYDSLSSADCLVQPVGKPYRLVVQTDLWFTVRPERLTHYTGHLGPNDREAVRYVNRWLNSFGDDPGPQHAQQPGRDLQGPNDPLWQYKASWRPVIDWLQQGYFADVFGDE